MRQQQLELDLKATLMPFPPARRSRLVDEVARTLLQMSGPKADAFWRRTVDDVSMPLLMLGVPRQAVEREVYRFFDAVEAAMNAADAGVGAG